MRRRHGVSGIGAMSAILIAAASFAHAQSPAFIRDCQPWIEKRGYSTDYIESKTGKSQGGLAGKWRGNVARETVRPGDVILIALSAPGAQHAALVEEVRTGADGAVSAVRVSEWNWGRMVEPRCMITETFGRLAPPRWVKIDSIAHVWRPSEAPR